MRYLFGFICVCALGAMPLAGCSETSGQSGSETNCYDPCDGGHGGGCYGPMTSGIYLGEDTFRLSSDPGAPELRVAVRFEVDDCEALVPTTECPIDSVVEQALIEPAADGKTVLTYVVAADVAPYMRPFVPALRRRLGALFTKGLAGIENQVARLRKEAA